MWSARYASVGTQKTRKIFSARSRPKKKNGITTLLTKNINGTSIYQKYFNTRFLDGPGESSTIIE